MNPFRPLSSLLILFLAAGSSYLFAQVDPSRPMCGTFLLVDLESRIDRLDDKDRQLLSQLQTTERLDLERSIVSRAGHFRIHFNTEGPWAPSPVDADDNGVPDYIDSVDFYMEHAWHHEIDVCRYAAPPPDNVVQGAGGIDGRIDVYIKDFGGAVYGLAYPDYRIPLGGDKVHGYMLLDNDFATDEGYPTPGIDGLRITCAHEFHHIVQFASYREELAQAAFYEATSTWIEYKLHPDVEDYRGYFNIFLKSPHTRAFSTHNTSDTATGYAHMHYLQSVVQQTDADIVRRMWEVFAKNGKCFDAIDRALVESGSGLNLSNSFCTFARWSYFTGVHAADRPYFKKAELYPTIVPAQIRSMPPEGETIFAGTLMPLSFGVWRLTMEGTGADPDIVDFLITNGRSDIGAGGPTWLNRAEVFTLDVSTVQQHDYLPVRFGSQEIFYRLKASHPNFCVEAIVNGNPAVVAVANPTPQPFRNDGADRMVFAVNLGEGTAVTDIRLDIYSSSMTRVTTIDRTELETLENLRGVIWDGRDERGAPVPGGVYIYTLSINNGEPSVGKFAVVR